MTTTLTDKLPQALADAVQELNRRAQAVATTCAKTAAVTASTEPTCVVVINDAPDALRDPAIRTAALDLAKAGRSVNIRLELCGVPLAPQLADFGGSRLLQDMALGNATDHVTYQCMRPLTTVPLTVLEPGVTRVRHADPRVRAQGRPDGGVLLAWDGGTWVTIRFDGTDQPSQLLAADISVEIHRQ